MIYSYIFIEPNLNSFIEFTRRVGLDAKMSIIFSALKKTRKKRATRLKNIIKLWTLTVKNVPDTVDFVFNINFHTDFVNSLFVCTLFIYFFLAKSPELIFTRMCRKRADYASVWSDLMSRNVTADRRILLLLQHRDRAWFHIIFFRTTRFLRAYNHLRLLCIPLYAYLISLIGKTSVRNRAVYNCLIHIYIFFIFGFFFLQR